MNKYNAEHYRDETAAIAISRADKARRRLKKEPIRRLVGLTYKIGEVYQVAYRCDKHRNTHCSGNAQCTRLKDYPCCATTNYMMADKSGEIIWMVRRQGYGKGGRIVFMDKQTGKVYR